MRYLCLLVLLAPSLLAAQTRPARPAPKKAAPAAAPAAPANRWPIETLAVEGNRFYTRDQVVAVAGLKIGQMAGKPEFEAARDRLVASGAFETVGYRFQPGANGGYNAAFQVTEVETAYPVKFEELGVPDADLEGMLHARDPLFSIVRVPATQAVMERYTRWVQEYLDSKGLKEKIAGRVTPLAPEQFAFVFRPARNLPAVAQVTFEGNQVVPQSLLREAVHGTAIGFPYTEPHFRELLNSSVRPIYEARGRVGVAFTKIRTEPTKDVEGLHVFVGIDEGPSFELGNVTIGGETPVAPEALLKAGDFKKGDVANFDRVNEGLERIRKAVRHAGYLDVKVTTDRKIDDAAKKVDVIVLVSPGPQFTMGKVVFVGLDLDGEAEMNRIWTLKEGKAFNPDYPDFFLNRIREQGLFDNLAQTKAEIQINQKEHTADVTLRFAGADDATRGPRKRG
jgi:outer membrane protein insertion porin family